MLGFEYRGHMVVGVSGMHDERQTARAHGGDMRSKCCNLGILRTSVVAEVEPAFTDAHDFRMPRQPQQAIDGDIRLGFGIMRMDADRAEHILVTFGDGEDSRKARERRADRQHGRDAHAPRPVEDRVDLAFELGMIEVAVTVDQHHQALALSARSTYLGKTADAAGSNVPGSTAWSAVIEANVRVSFGMHN